MSVPLSRFEMVPTHNCNFRCPYCFESHRLGKGSEWLSKRMPPDVLDAFFEAIKRHQRRGCNVSAVNLFGGEPLLAENRDFIRAICERCRELRVPIEVVTNGYDLDSYLDMAVEYEWGDVQVTIDGFGELTDRLRRHRSGGPTYERVMTNVAAISSLGIEATLRVLVDRERLGHLHEVVEDVRARGLEKDDRKFFYNFSPVVLPNSPEREVTPKQILDALVEQGLSFDEARRHVPAYRRAWDDTLKNMEKKGLPTIRPSRCSAIEGRTSVDPYGRVYRCFYAVGRDGEEVGVIREDGSFSPNANALLWSMRDAARLPKCHRCPYVFTCGGGCAAEAFFRSGSWFRPDRGQTFEMYDFTLPRVVGRTWNEGDDPELCLSWTEPLSHMDRVARDRFMDLSGASESMAFADERGWFELVS